MRWRASPMKRTRRAARSARPPTSSCTRPSASSDSALMVKSRRRASAAKSRPKRTLAWRPSVSMSWRSVVASIGRPSTISVTVPCATPVGAKPKPAALRARHHHLGRRGRGEIEIAGRLAQQQVAHRAADQPRLLAVAVEQRQRAASGGRLQRRRDRRAGRRAAQAHSNRPGTMTPFSRWAGT